MARCIRRAGKGLLEVKASDDVRFSLQTLMSFTIFKSNTRVFTRGTKTEGY
tara:strand:+ start:15422 stop:15574 length:153 start_codon:yes stop_codon:yes gene_type:complete